MKGFSFTMSVLMVWLISTPVYAITRDQVIIRALDPLISLIQGLAFPICLLSMSGGSLLIMIGQRSKGLEMIKWAALGYVVLQLVPGIMQMVVSVGIAMRQAQ